MKGNGGLIKVVNKQGFPMVVTITNAAGNSPVCYSDENLTTTRVMPLMITDTTRFYIELPATYTLSVKVNGREIASGTDTTMQAQLSNNNALVIEPVLESWQITGLNTPRPANTMILMGDSISGFNGGISTATPVQAISVQQDSRGPHRWAAVMLNHDLEIIGNSGIGGQNTTAMLARFGTDVLAYNAAIVSILGGTNDAVTDPTIANLKAMYTLALNAGSLVLAQTILPGTLAGTPVENYRMQVNDWIRRYSIATPGIILADIATAWQDPSLSGFKGKASFMQADGVHPCSPGAAAAGRVIADALRPFVPHNRLRAQASVAPYNLISNPHFNGSGTSTPAGWATVGSPTLSYVARPDGLLGQSLQLIVATNGAVNLSYNAAISAGTLDIGDVVQFGIEFDIIALDATSTGNQFMSASVADYNGATFNTGDRDLYWDTTALVYTNARYPYPSGAFLTAKHTVAAATTIVQPIISFGGGGTYQVKGAFLRNLTKMGVT